MNEENEEWEEEDEEEEDENEEWEILVLEEKEPKTEIKVEKKDETVDLNKCPFCDSTNIGKDPNINAYKCFECGEVYVWEG